MGMVARVGRKRWTTRMLLTSFVVLLLLGALTMLYPFALMLTGSTKSTVDIRERQLLPSFLVSRDALWRKHIEGLFNETLVLMRCVYNNSATSFERAPAPKAPNKFLVGEWIRFLGEKQFPPTHYTVGYLEAATTKRVLPRALRDFRSELSSEFNGDINAMNRAMGTEFTDWSDLRLLLPQYLQRTQSRSKAEMNGRLEQFMQRQPISSRVYFSVEGYYREQYLRPEYGNIATYNARNGTHYASFGEMRLPRTAADCENDAVRASWETFVRTIVHLLWIRFSPDADEPYRAFVEAKYRTIANLNLGYHTEYHSFAEFRGPREAPPDGLLRSDWNEFLKGWRDPDTGTLHQAPLNALSIDSVEFQFQDHLRSRYRSVEELNRLAGTTFAAFAHVVMPQEDLHAQSFLETTGTLRWEFVRRNYLTVIDYVALHGRAVWNTIVYCGLAILASIIVNPLAAYALSRYRPPGTYKLLLFLMLTMAFPPMVTQIPVFLMLRDFGLLNSYAALILPGLANGYSVFLLKGFFDSLPQELYESATLDGAGEIRIFWQITMSLSKPILAVIALNAFTSAYANFMFALLICQDEKMWTLMVWLYQLQSRASQGVVLASVTLAAIPTLVVYVLCQRVIMRGIVVPVEK
jgi:multiple sugar transport system permease protein